MHNEDIAYLQSAKKTIIAEVWADIKFYLQSLLPPTCYYCNLAYGYPGSLTMACPECQEQIDLITVNNLLLSDNLVILNACLYAQPIVDILRLYKFHQQPELAIALANLLLNAYLQFKNQTDNKTIFRNRNAEIYFGLTPPLQGDWQVLLSREQLNFDGILAVPLHDSRLRQRGYNQSGLLVETMRQYFPLTDYSPCLRRVIATKRQTEVSSNYQRSQNVSGAFAVVEPSSIYGKNLILVDDVVTTGSTLNSCAKVLKKAGAASVLGLVVASNHAPMQPYLFSGESLG